MKVNKNIFIEFFFKSIKKKYLKRNPLPPEIKSAIKKNLVEFKTRIHEVNQIRVDNITNTLWSNTGALFGIIITYASFLFTLFYTITSYISFKSIYNLLPKTYQLVLSYLLPLIVYSLLIILVYLLVVRTIPIIIKHIVYHLPPKEYAEITFSNLNQSEILTFTALKMWELCELVTSKISFDENLKELLLFHPKSGFKLNKRLYTKAEKQKENLISIQKLSKNLKELNKIYYKYHYNAIEVKNLATKKLGIQEREFCHHILKFSPAILDSRLSTLKLSVDTLQYILENEKFDREEFILVFENHLKEAFRIYNDIGTKGMTSLMQLIVFQDIHKYIIGIASVTSTSRCLKIFLRGLSSIIEKKTKSSNQPEKQNIQIQGEFNSILHRSKAHYGMDLLLAVENLYNKKNFKGQEKDIPKVLYYLKYPKGITGIGPAKFDKIQAHKMSFNFLIEDYQHPLRSMRNHFLLFYKNDINLIKRNFNKQLEIYLAKQGKKYFCIFGYSRIVRNVMKSFASKFMRDDVNIFVLKQVGQQMMDTRIMRFELNDEKPTNNIRNTFTSSDDFFLSLVQKEDNVIFIAGAEAYCEKTKLLFHTNSYQNRLNRLIKVLEVNKNKPKPDVWIVANDYKIFDSLPPKNYLFRKELLSDHYDKVDLYDFKSIKGNVTLITNK